MLLVLLFCCLLCPALSYSQCVYSLPASPGNKSSCAQFDLTLLAHYGPYNVSSFDGSYWEFYLKVCDVITTDMPDVCVSKKPSPAYKYLHECRILGDIMQGFVFPLDPLDVTKGISISYSGGEQGVDGYWPTAVVYDLHCDHSGVSKLPTVSYEWPEATFRVKWETGYACPQIIKSKSCRPSSPPDGWNGNRFRNYPQWYNGAKFGIMVTWGLFSVPGYGNESYWRNLENGDPDTVRYHNRVFGCSGVEPDKFPCRGPKFTYQDFVPLFKAEHFDPDHWADVFQKAGAKYVVFTTKYQTGWCNFPSQNHPGWNSVDVGPHRDLTGNLTSSVRKKGLKMGFYHSLKEWYNPIYTEDIKHNCTSNKFARKVLLPNLKQLVNSYKPDLLLSDAIEDGECSQDSVKYWKSDTFLEWLYTKSPVKDTVVTNSNWGFNSFGSYYGSNAKDAIGFQRYKWELPFGIQNDSFGFNYKYNLTDVRNTTEILWNLMATVSNNGNFLLNVGPSANGTIHPMFEAILYNIGKWMTINGEAVYDTIPWKHQTDTPNNTAGVWYTASVDWYTVYAVTFRRLIPGGKVILQQPIASASKSQVYWLTDSGQKNLTYQSLKEGGIEISIPRSVAPGTLPHTFKMTYVS